jgi:hypothetical protein
MARRACKWGSNASLSCRIPPGSVRRSPERHLGGRELDAHQVAISRSIVPLKDRHGVVIGPGRLDVTPVTLAKPAGRDVVV